MTSTSTLTPLDRPVEILPSQRIARSEGAPGEEMAVDLPAAAERSLDQAVEALFRKLKSRRGQGVESEGSDEGGAEEGGADEEGLHWCAELEGDSILSSEYLLMKWILSQEADGPAEDPRRFQRICNHMRLVQREDGTWGQYPGSPPDVSACVKAYFALKLFGDDVDAPHMVRAREAILRLGGAERINTFSMFYLACLGQVSWDACPAIPPEIVLLPRWFPFHLDKVAAWTRTMILPLAICSALRPVREVPASLGIEELFIDKRARTRLNQDWDRGEPAGWKNFFLVCDRLLKVVQKHDLSPLRTRALRQAEQWLLARMTPETTEGLGAIFPPMVYIQVAFKAMGYERSHPVIVEAERQLDAFMVEERHEGTEARRHGGGENGQRDRGIEGQRDHVRIQPCFSPVWDTGISLYALTEAGLTAADDERVARVCDWLVSRQVRLTGDWVRNLERDEQSIRLGDDGAAWAFEYRNEWYPDVDDTAMVAKALWRAAELQSSKADEGESGRRERGRDGETKRRSELYRATAARARRWILAMQNDDGGWAAFDKTKDRPWMEAVPFADHNAMQDPSCSDITGRTIESLITCGLERDHPAITRAVKYLLQTQCEDGSWIGRWGVNYIYGTWQAMGGLFWAMGGGGMDHGQWTMDNGAERGLARVRSFAPMRRAVEWVKSVQNPDGGFGESANSYLDPRLKGCGPSTASQTAWGLSCLLYVCHPDEPCVQRAVKWLCDEQLAADKQGFEPARTVSGRAVYGTEELAAKDWVHDFKGGFCEHVFTGTGFPKVFYLRYNMYRHYFPVMALGRYVNAARG